MNEIPGDLFGKAIDAWVDHCEEHNYIYQQASRADSYVNSRNVVLRNVNGLLARYSIKRQQIL